jgi:hypothetical protein
MGCCHVVSKTLLTISYQMYSRGNLIWQLWIENNVVVFGVLVKIS